MSDTKTQPEPSMEEILASIRRIISEDDAPAADAAAAPEPAKPAPAAKAEQSPMPPMPTPPPQPKRAPEPEPDQGDKDVLELTEMVSHDGSVVSLAEPDMPEPMAAEPEPPPPRPRRSDSPPGEGLMSQSATMSSAGSIASLSQALMGDYSDLLGNMGRMTVEDLVRELLRPLLKEWLDRNLPPLVEQMVRNEIQRIVRQARVN